MDVTTKTGHPHLGRILAAAALVLGCGSSAAKTPTSAASSDEPDAVHAQTVGDGGSTAATDGAASSDAAAATAKTPVKGKKALVAFVAAATGNGLVRVDLPSGTSKPIALPAGKADWTRIGWHFSSATVGGMVLRAPDGQTACFWRYDAAANAWQPASLVFNGDQRCLKPEYREVFGDAGGHQVVFTSTAGDIYLVRLGPPLGDATNIRLDGIIQRPDPQLQFYGINGDSLGYIEGPDAFDPSRLALMGIADATVTGELSLLLAYADKPDSLSLYKHTTLVGTPAHHTELAVGARHFLGSWNQADEFLLGPGLMACKGADCALVGAKRKPLPIFHHPGPAVAVVYPGSAGEGFVSLFDVRKHRPYEMEVQLPFDAKQVTIDGWFPDEHGPGWVRLVGFDGATGTGFELPVDLDTLAVAKPEPPRYAPLLAQPAAPQRFAFTDGYFFAVPGG